MCSSDLPGTGESSTADALQWARAAIGQIGGAPGAAADTILRPTPKLARLAYMMLANMGA